VPSKKYSKNLWRSAEVLGSLFKTWWRAKRGTWPNNSSGESQEEVEERTLSLASY